MIANRGLSVQSLEINKIGPKKGSKMDPEIGSKNTTEIAPQKQDRNKAGVERTIIVVVYTLLQVGSNIPFVKAMTSLKSGLDK